MPLVETTINRLKQAPQHSLDPTTKTSAAMEMSHSEASNAITSATTGTNDICKIKNKRTVFSTDK